MLDMDTSTTALTTATAKIAACLRSIRFTRCRDRRGRILIHLQERFRRRSSVNDGGFTSARWMWLCGNHRPRTRNSSLSSPSTKLVDRMGDLLRGGGIDSSCV